MNSTSSVRFANKTVDLKKKLPEFTTWPDAPLRDIPNTIYPGDIPLMHSMSMYRGFFSHIVNNINHHYSILFYD